MLYENWLHLSSLNVKSPDCPPLKKNIKTDYLVIGGGFAGLHAALRLINRGKKVVLLEKKIIGSSSSGQSAGFLVPESESDIAQLIATFGEKKAKILYNIPKKGVDLIVKTAQKNNFNCDLKKQDSLYLSVKKAHDKHIKEEAKIREEEGREYHLYNSKTLKKIHPGKGYTFGLKYPGSYGINSFAYCQEMKNLLLKKGVIIYENSEVEKIEENTAKLSNGSVKAKNILVCIDKMKKQFNKDISKRLYSVQTYLAISEPLKEHEMKSLFPKEELMCWDTNLLYVHYRPVAENRLIIGGSSAWATYSPKTIYRSRIIKKFINKLKERFPAIEHINFISYWSGLIDVTQDLIPIIDYDKNNKSIQYAVGCAGLNWAAYCGDYIARRAMSPSTAENLSEFTRSDRKFFFPEFVQKILGKRITFALSHLREYFKT